MAAENRLWIFKSKKLVFNIFTYKWLHLSLLSLWGSIQGLCVSQARTDDVCVFCPWHPTNFCTGVQTSSTLPGWPVELGSFAWFPTDTWLSPFPGCTLLGMYNSMRVRLPVQKTFSEPAERGFPIGTAGSGFLQWCAGSSYNEWRVAGPFFFFSWLSTKCTLYLRQEVAG